MNTFRIGGERQEFLAVTVLGRSHPDCVDYWDGNWVHAAVEVAAGGFRGEVGGHLRAEELANFHRDLVPLAETLVGGASFSTMEDWLSIVATGDGRGHIMWACEIRDRPGDGNRLAVRLELDQTFLTPMLEQLVRVLAGFPVLGRPGDRLEF